MSDFFDINSEMDKKINDELNKLQTIEEKIMEKMPNIKNVKFQKASDYVPKCLQITREDNVKYNVIYNIDYPDTGEYETLQSKIQIKSITTRLIFHHNEVLNKIIKIEDTIKEIINAIRKLNFKSKIKYMGDSINREQFSKEDLSTHYSGNQYIFSFKVKNRIITKEYSQDNFDSLTIISEILSFYSEPIKIVNYRKNIIKAFYQEKSRLKQLKAYKAYDEGDWKSNQEEITQSESRLKLLKELQEPLKDYYYL